MVEVDLVCEDRDFEEPKLIIGFGDDKGKEGKTALWDLKCPLGELYECQGQLRYRREICYVLIGKRVSHPPSGSWCNLALILISKGTEGVFERIGLLEVEERRKWFDNAKVVTITIV